MVHFTVPTAQNVLLWILSSSEGMTQWVHSDAKVAFENFYFYGFTEYFLK